MRYATERESGAVPTDRPARKELGACLLDWTNDGEYVRRLHGEIQFMLGHHRRLVDEVMGSLARILEHHGHTVAREYYFNDAGSQIRLLGESVVARATGSEVPEGGYQGDYVSDLAARIPEARDPGADVDVVARRAVEVRRCRTGRGSARARRRAARRGP